jgi:tRNA-2-methylthio-N6-dimethylallyladenosine synthase
MNEYDSDFLAGSLIDLGLSPVDVPEAADVLLINTCTVRAKPEQKAYSLLGRFSEIKNRKSDVILGVVGCLAQQKSAELLKRFPGIDFVLGPRDLSGIRGVIQELQSAIRKRKKIVATELENSIPAPKTAFTRSNGGVTAFVSIMEGCNNFCSYCIVPYVRGREVSRSPDDIILEVRNLIACGVKEITLLGQNVNSYCWAEARETSDFVSLLAKLDEIEGLRRVRFTTSHPKDLSGELIECFGTLNKLCPHIHLPFQAGSNEVLKRMKRRYTREKYMDHVARLREVVPDIAITSDVMVGFPGESEQDFESTLDLIRSVQFDGLFSFKYSDRKGTVSNEMPDKIGESEKSRRLKILQSLQKQITLIKNKAIEGRTVEVLVEGQSKKGGQLTGRTGSNKTVNFISDKEVIGEIVNVYIERGFLNSLRGRQLLRM